MKASLTMPPALYKMLEDLAALGEDIDLIAGEVLEAGADVAVDGMQKRVRKDKRTLMKTLQKGPIERDGNRSSIVVGQQDGTDPREVIKANVHEFGSTTIKAESFVRPTMQNDRAKINRAMKSKAQEYGLADE